MNKIIHFFITGLMLCILGGTASAAVVFSTANSNTEIAASFSGNDIAITDINGDGYSDRGIPTFESYAEVAGAPDVSNIQRITVSNKKRFALTDPLNGKLLLKVQPMNFPLTYDVDVANPWNFAMDSGLGVFTSGSKRFFVFMTAVESWLPVPLLSGTTYIEGALSVAVADAVTGAKVAEFTVTSNSTWWLAPFESRFIDINGKTYFQERFIKRYTTPPAPGATVIEEHQFNLWNFKHTKLIKSYIRKITLK